MSNLMNTVLTGLTLVGGLFCGYTAMFFMQQKNHEASQDWLFDLAGYGFGAVAIGLIAAFVAFAYRMNQKTG